MRYPFIFFFLIQTFLFAENQWDNWDYPLFDLENTPSAIYPFSISGQYVAVQKTPFRTPSLQDQELLYQERDIAFSYTHPFNQIHGLILGAGWVETEVNFKKNPEFKETIFSYINFSLGGFTKAFDDWTWSLTLAAFLDTVTLSFSEYALYQGVLWGKYNLYEWVEFDFGLILELGLNKEKVWPIIGFMYTPWPNWHINCVYPINISLEYEPSSYWKCAGSIRFLRNRHRTHVNEPNSQGIFEYHTTGAELDLIFSPLKWVLVKGFIGHAFSGDLKITDQRDKNAHHYKFESSLYAGVNAIISF